jgi:hypothetical protein
LGGIVTGMPRMLEADLLISGGIVANETGASARTWR